MKVDDTWKNMTATHVQTGKVRSICGAFAKSAAFNGQWRRIKFFSVKEVPTLG